MEKYIKKIIIFSLIFFILIGLGIFLYKYINKEKKENQIIEKIDIIDENLNELEHDLITNTKHFNDNYYSNNQFLEMELEEFGFEKVEPIQSFKDQIRINIDTNTYIKDFPTTGQDLTNTIKFLEKTINNLNQIRMNEKKLANTVFTNTIIKVQTTKTNIVYLKEEVKQQNKIDFIQWGIGGSFSFNGKSSTGVVLYDLTLDGTVIFLNSIYIQLGVGYMYDLYYYPKFSIGAGYIF